MTPGRWGVPLGRRGAPWGGGVTLGRWGDPGEVGRPLGGGVPRHSDTPSLAHSSAECLERWLTARHQRQHRPPALSQENRGSGPCGKELRESGGLPGGRGL